MLQKGLCRERGTLSFGHLFTIHGQEAVNANFGWKIVSGCFQHPRPEQRMEIDNVFSNEMMDFAVRVFPPVIQSLAIRIAPLLCRSDVSDRGIEPDIPIVSRAVRDLETEILCGARNVPVAKFVTKELTIDVVGDFWLKTVAILSPIDQKFTQLFQFDEQVVGVTNLGLGSRKRADRINQLNRRISMSTFAVVAGLILSIAFRASAGNKSVGQKSFFFGVVKLFDLFGFHQSRVANRLPDLSAELSIFVAVGAAIVVEADSESCEISLMSFTGFCDNFFGCSSFLLSTKHDRSAVSIVGANEKRFVAT